MNQGSILCALRGKQEITNDTSCFRSSDKEKNDVLIADEARWDEQLKGLIELERRCLTLREEVEHLSEEVQRQIFEELKEFEEQKAQEALALVDHWKRRASCDLHERVILAY